MTVGILTFITVLWPTIRERWRILLACTGVALILLVGFARVALNIHHPSDVLAGWSLGVAYYLVIASGFSPYQSSAFAIPGRAKKYPPRRADVVDQRFVDEARLHGFELALKCPAGRR